MLEASKGQDSRQEGLRTNSNGHGREGKSPLPSKIRKSLKRGTIAPCVRAQSEHKAS